MEKLNFIDRIVLDQDQVKIISAVVSNKIYDYYSLKKITDVTVLVIMEGASRFSDDIFCDRNLPSYDSNLKFHHFYIKASSYCGGTESNRNVLVTTDVDEEHLRNKHILIIDDIYDTGNTLFAVLQKIKKFDPLSIECSVFIERLGGHEKDINVKFVGWETEIKDFLIGYGLDYKEKFRTLPYVATLNREANIKELAYRKIVCNKCGKDCISFKDGEETTFYGLLDARVRGSYYSPVLEDLMEYRFDLCESCLKELFDTFKIPVTKKEYNIFL